jgi:hypothetical protein
MAKDRVFFAADCWRQPGRQDRYWADTGGGDFFNLENGEMNWPTLLALVVLFGGVAYWAFRPGWRNRRREDDPDGGGSSS